ncbi:hypothetical protein ABGB17_34955 [Sphaerisporangium sp. B11E5]|uniref:hypothetical protein n=1 Tax=Sphaerisporangium sp. B11E5 TaxID=3153563 RepID=UPI00325C7EDF
MSAVDRLGSTSAGAWNDAPAAASQRGAEILGVATPAGARFASSAELLHLLSEAFRKVVEQWQDIRKPPR